MRLCNASQMADCKCCWKYVPNISRYFLNKNTQKIPGFFQTYIPILGKNAEYLTKQLIYYLTFEKKKFPKYLMQLCVKEGWSHSMFVKLVSHWKKEREESKCVKRGVFIPYFLLHGRKYYKNVPLNNCIFFVSFRRPHELQLGDFNARHHIHWGRKKCLFT